MTAKHAPATPITDRIEMSVMAQGNRYVPARVYQQMRALEDDRARLIEALREARAVLIGSDREFCWLNAPSLPEETPVTRVEALLRDLGEDEA